MKIRAREPTETFEPDWQGNLSLPEGERVKITHRLITVGDENKAQAQQLQRAMKRKRLGLLAAEEPLRIIRSCVLSVVNLHVEHPDGRTESPKNGEELAAVISTMPGSAIWGELGDLIIKAVKGASELEEEAGNESAPSLAS